MPTKCHSGITAACTLFMFFIMFFAQAAVGYKYLNDCSRQPFIPIYLLVMGGGILIFCCKKMCSMLITFFFFCWFIAGNVCIFTIYKPDFEMRGDNYCDKTLYLFAFGSTIFTYVLIGVMCVAWYHEEEDQGHNTPV